MYTALAVAAVVAIVAILFFRGGDDDGARGDADASGGPQRDTVAGRAGASPTRGAPDDSFGAQFRGHGAVQIEGRVVDGITREPIGGVDVIFARAIGEEIVTSGAGGAFTITLAPGEYELRAVGERAYAPARKLVVGRVTQPLSVEVAVSRLATVVGRVVDGDGAPVAGVTVSLRLEGAVKDAYEKDAVSDPLTTTRGDGGFEIAVLPGTVKLFAESDRGSGSVSLEGVAPGTTTSGVEIRLRPFASVAGVVRDPEGRPIGGARVHMFLRVPGAATRQIEDATSGPDGRFAFPRVYNGRLYLDARLDGFGLAAPFRSSLEPGQRLDDVVLQLTEPRSIAGRVVDTEGVPVPAVKVYLDRDGSRLGLVPVRTDGDGEFSFHDLDGGPYILRTKRAGYAPTSRKDLRAPLSNLEIVVGGPASLRGTVLGPDGKPVPEFTVAAGSRAPARFAAADGRWELPEVEPGEYKVTIEAPGYDAIHRTVEVAPGQTVPVDVTLVR